MEVLGASAITTEFLGEYKLSEYLEKSTIRYMLNPHKYIDLEAVEDIENPRELSDGFEYKPNPVFGLYDVVRPVAETIKHESGDCVDYSAVALSWFLRYTDNDMYLATLLPDGDMRIPHVIVSTGHTAYDQNTSVKGGLKEFADKHDYRVFYVTKIENTDGPVTEDDISTFYRW